MTKQSTDKILMVEPRGFCANPQTIQTNAHQVQDDVPAYIVQENALSEHQHLVQKLRDNQVDVELFTGQQQTPDDLFCNNWVSFHEEKQYVLYPLLAPNRRLERRKDLCQQFEKTYGQPIDFSDFESQGKYLESTGSMVLDRVNRVAYAALSPRTDKSLFLKWCEKLNYEPVTFSWTYPDHQPVYHTNVIMFIGTSVIGVCAEGILESQREQVLSKIQTHHEVVLLSYDQINHYCGNALELVSANQKKLLVMSSSAFNALTDVQKNTLQQHVEKIVHSDISTIERYGGGSVRCLILEKFE